MARQTDHWNTLILVIGGAYILSQLYLAGLRESGSSPGEAQPVATYKTQLTPRSSILSTDRDGRSALHLAAMAGLSDLVEVYLNRGADLEAPDRWGNTPLLLAAAFGHEKTVALFLSKGARVDISNHGGRTPLLAALSGGHGKAADVLADAGADIKAVDKNHFTALHCAAEGGLDEWVKRLLIMRLDPNALRINNWTPLHEATLRKHAKCALYLLEAGADPDIQVSYGHSSASIAKGGNDPETLAEFRKFRVRTKIMPDWMKPPAESGPLLPEAVPEIPKQHR